MKSVIAFVLSLALTGAALAQNYGGGPGNSGPGDKNSQNYQGGGGQQPQNDKK